MTGEKTFSANALQGGSEFEVTMIPAATCIAGR